MKLDRTKERQLFQSINKILKHIKFNTQENKQFGRDGNENQGTGTLNPSISYK